MDNLIRQILDADEKAREKLSLANQKQNNISQIIEENKKNIYNKYLENARSQIENSINEEKSFAEEKLQATRIKYSAALSYLDESYVNNSEQWVDGIVENIIKKAFGN